MTINHLKNRDAQRKTLAVAYGRHAVKGHLCWSKAEGTHIKAYNALGEGEWDACEAAYYRGAEILPDFYNFHPGALAEGMDSGPQIVDPFFPLDVPHTRTAAIGYQTPFDLGDIDTEKNPPLDFEGIFRTKKCPDFDTSGNLLSEHFTYSANPARCVAEALVTYGRLPNMPIAYEKAIDYWRTRIDWGAWSEWRDYCGASEWVDYVGFGSGDGFGLTASYYEGLQHDTFITSFVQPVIDIQLGDDVSPAAGVPANDFSAKFEGRICSKMSGNVTFHLTHDDGARLTIDGTVVIDQWDVHGAGSHDGVISLIEGSYYDILLEWQESGGPGQIKMEWSGKSNPTELVSSKYLYPRAENRPRYESHVYFNSPTNFADVIRTILFVSNSVMQDVNGKLRFFCLEQLAAPTFDFTNANIDSFTFRRRDILQNEAVTSYEAKFRDLDSQFLEEPPSPIHLELDYFTRKNNESIKVVDQFNTTRWQAMKVLRTRARLETGNDLMCEIGSKMAKTYSVMPGDLVTVTHRKTGEDPQHYLVREATDGAAAEASGSLGTEVESRTFTLQEWPEE